MKRNVVLIGIIFLLLTSCTVGPNYVKPVVEIPSQYKEAGSTWKVAHPQDAAIAEKWWEIFQDDTLNHLQEELNQANQSLVASVANYHQAEALVEAARSSFFPTLKATGALTRQKSSSLTNIASSPITTLTSLLLNSTWEPDIWGSVRRQVEASKNTMEASRALLAATRLSLQGTLAQTYFELRTLDADQQFLNTNVNHYKKLLKFPQNQYKAGIVSQEAVLQAESALKNAEAEALNIGIARAQYEHAIAVLAGKNPSNFSLPSVPLKKIEFTLPMQLPSLLLERRPDVAQAERLMAEANAEIGIAIAAYFPNFILSASQGFSGVHGMSQLFSEPAKNWAVGPQVSETLFDANLRTATVKAARANYEAVVATYREKVLEAFQDVEDNLVAQRVLEEELAVLEQAQSHQQKLLQLSRNQYKAGTVSLAHVVTAEINAINAEKATTDVNGLRSSAVVGLIKALGGSWSDVSK